METVVLPDNGFGGPPAGKNHWHILNTTVRSGEDRKREGVRQRKDDEEGRIKAEILRSPPPFASEVRVKLPP